MLWVRCYRRLCSGRWRSGCRSQEPRGSSFQGTRKKGRSGARRALFGCPGSVANFPHPLNSLERRAFSSGLLRAADLETPSKEVEEENEETNNSRLVQSFYEVPSGRTTKEVEEEVCAHLAMQVGYDSIIRHLLRIFVYFCFVMSWNAFKTETEFR